MTGYVFAHGTCIGCGRLFSFNPVYVPSHRHPSTGQREPICQACVDRINPRRIANGVPPIIPHPEAYEPCPESEVPWND